ncbi:hypothetical protein PMZ80_000812 [Knufia obscura]|uniref:Agmatinase n=2 Tax=Knufia TaxID=430999 RepID=A0AAN8I364_9EURO|nr:hypothetical protein PMZ80_000812 [Knufia obscura]KAK5949924.1 hypothetical protein OHC33_009109 [Knufia fluminis]
MQLFITFVLFLLALLRLSRASFYDNPPLELPPAEGTPLDELERKWGTDFGFSGIMTYAHLPHIRCLTTPSELFDIGILGVPFDTSVSYRTGARFGPRAIRAASARQTSFRGFNARAGLNPYTAWPKILDCGDVPVSPFDNALALRQMSEAYLELVNRRALSYDESTFWTHPRVVSLGGDHSIALPALRALNKVYEQPIAVLHFDAHLDTWHPAKYPSAWFESPGAQSDMNHGSMFWIASNEGLILNSSSVHAGLRTRLSGDDFGDYHDDDRQGFLRIETDDIDVLGVNGIVRTILDTIGTETPLYLSIDIDVLDPGIAPGTGTPEPGGWTTRELIQILRGIEGLNIVGADVVEVSPGYDDRAEGTALAGAHVAYEIITSIVKRGMKDRGLWVESEHEKPGRLSNWRDKAKQVISDMGDGAQKVVGARNEL